MHCMLPHPPKVAGEPGAPIPADPTAGLRLLGGLGTDARAAVTASARRVRRARGQRLFRQGDPAEWFYLLQEGRVRLTQLTPDGHMVLLRLVLPGEAFGGVAALGSRTYPVSAEAAEDCVAMAWGGETMHKLLRGCPQLAINLIGLLAERLHVMQARYQELATQQVEQRLARALLRLAERAGRRVEGGVLVDVRLSRQDLAEMTGTSLFTVSRILRRWQRGGTIRSQRQRILVRHPHGLLSIAEGLPAAGDGSPGPADPPA